MKTKALFFISTLFVIAIIVSSCGSTKTMALNSIELTSRLKPGMTYDEVREILGNPKSTQVVEDKMIARWNLQEMWVGYKPYDMVFTASDMTLVSWSENTAAFNQSQENLKKITEATTAAVNESSSSGQGTGSTASPSAGPNDEGLMKYFAGMYYSFSASGGGTTGGSERKMSLCSNGRYRDSFESGYSGSGWGTANQSGGSGTWRITGSKTEGTIVTVSSSGKTNTYNYRVCGDGCIYLGNIKFAYAGAEDCR